MVYEIFHAILRSSQVVHHKIQNEVQNHLTNKKKKKQLKRVKFQTCKNLKKENNYR